MLIPIGELDNNFARIDAIVASTDDGRISAQRAYFRKMPASDREDTFNKVLEATADCQAHSYVLTKLFDLCLQNRDEQVKKALIELNYETEQSLSANPSFYSLYEKIRGHLNNISEKLLKSFKILRGIEEVLEGLTLNTIELTMGLSPQVKLTFKKK